MWPMRSPKGTTAIIRRAGADQQAQMVVVVDRRPEDAEEGEQDEPADRNPRPAALKNRHAWRSGRPKRPCGRIIRIARSTRKGTRSPSFEPM